MRGRKLPANPFGWRREAVTVLAQNPRARGKAWGDSGGAVCAIQASRQTDDVPHSFFPAVLLECCSRHYPHLAYSKYFLAVWAGTLQYYKYVPRGFATLHHPAPEDYLFKGLPHQTQAALVTALSPQSGHKSTSHAVQW